MQLHHLSMTAIGPFAGTETIDFSTVGRAGLFLLEGPTGSGKSTIIDAITFALYGKVAQASADVERIHSHHADPRDVPVVVLVFETQSGIYRVRRTPRFERPKSRGDGTTTQQPTVKLWRIATPDDLSGGELLSTSIGDCDDEITRAVGLTRDQFVQTVILPQGEFATFLRARSEDKGKLLEKVFGTDFFRRVQVEVVETGRAASARRQAAVDEIADAVRALAVSASLDPLRRDALLAVSRESPESLPAELTQVVDELVTTERHATKRSREAIAEYQQMADMVGDARLRMQRRERLLDLQRRDEDLGRRAVHFRELGEAVARARQARPVAGAVRTLAKSEATLKRAEAALARARGRVEPDHRDDEVATLRETATRWRETIGALTGALETEAGLPARTAEQSRLDVDAGRCRATITAVAAELAALPSQIAAQETALSEARRLVALVEPRTAEAARARGRLEAAVAHDTELVRVTVRVREATERLQHVQDHEQVLSQLRRARIDAIAGELGLTLVDGEACPVCGATDHPVPARPTDDAVTAEQVSAQEDRLVLLHRDAEAATERLTAARSAQAELAVRAEGLDVEQARRASEAAAAALTEAVAAEPAAQAGARLLDALRAADDTLTERAAGAGADLARLEQASTDLTARLDRELTEVTAARAGHPSVAERRSELTSAVTCLDELVEAIGVRDTARRAVEEDEASRDADLEQAGFATLGDWVTADRPAEWITQTTTEIEAFEQECTRVKAGLSGPELADVQLDALFDDIDQLIALERVAKVEMETAGTELGSIRHQVTRSRTRVGEITAAMQRNAAIIAETADAVRVGLLVAGSGENQLNLDLAKYVLIRRFTQVLSAANTELARFSGGRYSLEHTDAKKGNAKSGLGVRVHDLHTNQVREVGTLSGGETFYVSLSLALALAEVVRSEVGGVDLGTLFVDEGFGTLDPDVLDDVMQTLEGLRAGGRTVGVVSHVTELKSRVADRIEVIVRDDHTSTIRVTA
ncbi:MAG: SMC family ATPase [Terracoccus sp.]